MFAMKDTEQQKKTETDLTASKVRLSVFFDTNQLGERITDEGSGDMLIHRMKASHTFYEIKKYLKTYGLSDCVQLLIPDISLREYKRQTIEIFLEHTKSIEPKIEIYKKVFGDILSVDFHFKYERLSDFEAYIDELIDTFLLENQCEIVSHPNKEQAFDRFVDKVINREPPFTEAHKDKKKYKDAGFKDAIIEDTIINYAKSTNNVCILVSSDNDWGRCFKKGNNIFVCKNTEQVVQTINKSLGLDKAELIIRKFIHSSYLIETAITMVGLKYESSAIFEVAFFDEIVEDENYILKIKYILDDNLSEIKCIYEESSNSIIRSEIVEDGD